LGWNVLKLTSLLSKCDFIAVDLMVIDAKFGRKNCGSIPYNCDWKGVETI
jgi:hypothetical protein